jgi:hypothetical protein
MAILSKKDKKKTLKKTHQEIKKNKHNFYNGVVKKLMP